MNPWTVKFSKEHKVFQEDLIQLVLYWIGQEYDIALSSDYKLPAAAYKGGTGNNPDNIETVPFELPRSSSDKGESEDSLSSPQTLMKQVISAREEQGSSGVASARDLATDQPSQTTAPYISEIGEDTTQKMNESEKDNPQYTSGKTDDKTSVTSAASDQQISEKPSTSLGFFQDGGKIYLDFTIKVKDRMTSKQE